MYHTSLNFSFRKFFYSMIFLINTIHICARHIISMKESFTDRSSHQSCSMQNSVFRNFTKLTEKRLCQSLFFNKVSTLLKKRLWHRCFPMNFEKFLRTPYFTEHLWTTASIQTYWLVGERSYFKYLREICPIIFLLDSFLIWHAAESIWKKCRIAFSIKSISN